MLIEFKTYEPKDEIQVVRASFLKETILTVIDSNVDVVIEEKTHQTTTVVIEGNEKNFGFTVLGTYDEIMEIMRKAEIF